MIHRTVIPYTLIKTSLYLSALFFLAFSLIRSQPYDDFDLRAFFQFADGCTMPCWYSIQLGSENLDSALSQLREFPAVQSVTKRAGNRHIWEWNSARPTIITGNLPQYVFSWHKNIAETISVQNLPSLWKIWLIWGEPDVITVSLIEPGKVLYISTYEQEAMHFFNVVDCSQLSREFLWNTESRLDVGRLVFFPRLPPIHYQDGKWVESFRNRSFC